MLPSEIEVFIKKKKDQCEKLIQFGIWGSRITLFSLKEKLYASCLLDWLACRNEEQI